MVVTAVPFVGRGNQDTSPASTAVGRQGGWEKASNSQHSVTSIADPTWLRSVSTACRADGNGTQDEPRRFPVVCPAPSAESSRLAPPPPNQAGSRLQPVSWLRGALT